MTTFILSLSHFAAEYGQGAYGMGLYSQGEPGALDSLANTGYDVLIPVFLGVSLIVASAILVTRRLLRRRIRAKLER